MKKTKQQRELIARVIILDFGRVLVNQGTNKRTGETYYALPGGHIEPGESCLATAHRELLEELDVEIQIGDLVLVSESIYPGRSRDDGVRHELVLYFEASLTRPPAMREGGLASPEKQKRFQWLALDQVRHANLLPACAKALLLAPESTARYQFHDSTQPDSAL